MAGWAAAAAVAGAAISGQGAASANQQSAVQAKRMYKHRYQWTVADLKAAGLNPMLAVQNGAPVPDTPRVENVGESAVRGASGGASAVVQARLAKAQMANIEADTNLKGTAAAVNIATARESSIRAGLGEAELPWAPMKAQATAQGADKALALQNQQLQYIGHQVEGLQIDNAQKKKINDLLVEAQTLINKGYRLDQVKKDAMAGLWSIAPDKETVDSALEILSDPASWPTRIREWAKRKGMDKPKYGYDSR